MLRRLRTDAVLAAVLMLLTVGPGTVSLLMGDQKTGATVPVDIAWWLLAALIVAGLLIRRSRPLLALALTAAGTTGHLLLQTKFQLLDLALPLVLYTVATVARRRRVAVALLAVVMLLTWTAMLTGRIRTDLADMRAAKADKMQVTEPMKPGAGKAATVSTATTWANAAMDSSQAVLEMWLLLVAAFAVGDGMRSRRAHLATLEQRTADLAREQQQRAALAVAAERARITRELHDVVAHGMSVMVVQAQGAAAALDRHPERTATALQHVIETGRSSLAEMRRLLAANRTEPAADLAPQPGLGAVPALVDQLRDAGMRVELHVDGVPDVVPPGVDLSAYRIVQEALTNTLKHAGPGAAVRVGLCFAPSRLRVEVTDDGAGPALGGAEHGNGLRGIAERVAMLGGTLETGRGDPAGFRLTATLPVGR
ncbi:sensor histidine kinase [Actinoplanes sp. NPDC020271]|uniref:sensor histidine kinase n=1 Tax=Actinoplanes sp. NPDC020271 TaxID=3363896 RepID=UPI0037B7E60A